MSDPLVANPSGGLLDRTIADTPIVVFALETTGFPAGRHRVCELSLCRLSADGSTELIFDSLIDPGRSLSGQEIHGLVERDLEGAPRFADVAGAVLEALEGAAVASYNVTFGIDFLREELERIGVEILPPHFCLMFLRPMLDLGPRCSLEEACAAHEIGFSGLACSRADAEAATDLLRLYLRTMQQRGVETFGQLASLGEFPFLGSLTAPPLRVAGEEWRRDVGSERLAKRRVVRSLGEGAQGEDRVRRYWQAVAAVAADYEVTEVELGLVRKMRELLDLSEEEMRAVHARAFMSAIVAFAGDDWLADDEAEKLRMLLGGLSSLGWAPGE